MTEEHDWGETNQWLYVLEGKTIESKFWRTCNTCVKKQTGYKVSEIVWEDDD